MTEEDILRMISGGGKMTETTIKLLGHSNGVIKQMGHSKNHISKLGHSSKAYKKM